jgi:carboxymethylenebutenolidase
MRPILALALLSAVTLSITPARAADTPAAAPAAAAVAAPAAPRDPKLPAGEADAKQVLETSPRHGEFIDIPYTEGKPALRTYIVYPERKDKAGVVILIHEIFGLSDWLRAVADQFAKDGFIAIAPDLISGLGPNGGGTEACASRDDVVKLVRQLTYDETKARLAAVHAYAKTIPSANGKWGTVGFCWGGGRSFQTACETDAPQAAVVFYGVSPDSAALLNLHSPVLGNYGGDDARVTSTIAPAQATLKAVKGSRYEPNVYDGAGHGFLRDQSGRDGANLKATQKAWPKTIEFLRKNLK